MLSHRAHIEVRLLVIEHVLNKEGVFSSLALHLCVEHVILDKRSYLIGYHILVVHLTAIARVSADC